MTNVTDSPTQADNIVVVENLSTTFSTPRGSLTAVNNVSLTIKRGMSLGIVGESGSGTLEALGFRSSHDFPGPNDGTHAHATRGRPDC